MSEPLYVDPEALSRLSRPYNAAAQDWLALKQHVADIKARYYGAWGDDDLGQQFGPQFTEGLNQIEERVNILGDTLNYYGDGLNESGLIYGEARDDAEQTSQQYLAVAEEACGPGQQPALSRKLAVQNQPATQEGYLQPALRMRGELMPARIAMRSVKPAEPGEPLQPLQPTQSFRRSVIPAEPGIEPLQPLQRMERIPAAAAGANPPPGEYWSDGYWVYTPGGAFIAIQNLESPYDHGAVAHPYQPGTVPQPASGVFPPAGQIWSDGVYLYSSDGAIRGLDTLDSPYDHV